jgi:uncharacterized membrane protein
MVKPVKAARTRFDRLDALRALAMLWMTAYHFAYDLNWFGYIRQDFFNDPVWTWQRTCIVSLFLFCAGVSSAVAHTQGQSAAGFRRRWLQVAGAALLVSAASYVAFGPRFIHFGVLHAAALFTVIGRFSAAWGRALGQLGLLIIAIYLIANYVHWTPAIFGFSSYFDSRWLNWLGWISAKPMTEDYVPVLPWLGVFWIGMAAGQAVLRAAPTMLTTPVSSPAAHFAAKAGRFSLSYYLLHQPVLIALLGAWRWCVG